MPTADVTVVTSTLSSLLTTTQGDEKQSPMSEKQVSDHLNFAMVAVVGPILCFLGMIGNVLSILVWHRPSMRSSTGRYLIGQAVADFCVLLFFILCESLQFWAPSIKNSLAYGVFFCYIGYPFFFLAIVCSIWFTVGVTVDRYIMVCWITKAKHYCNESRANIGLLIITVNSFLINFPHFLSFKPNFDGKGTNSTGDEPGFVETEFGGGDGGKFYEFWIHCIILILVPWVSVLFMNVKIIGQVNKSNQNMSDKKSSQAVLKSKQSENQITRLLLTVTFTFLFFIGLQCIIQCVFMQEPPGADMEHVKRAFAFARTGIVFNSSTNFLLYCLSGRRFRSQLYKMVGYKSRDDQFTSVVDRPSTSGPTASTTSTTGI